MNDTASFLGRVESADQEFAVTTLVNEATGEQVESCCEPSFLAKHNLSAGDEFRMEVICGGGTNVVNITKLPPKTVDLNALRKKFSIRWP